MEERTGARRGLGLVISKNIQYQKVLLQEYQDGVLETQAIKIHMSNSRTLYILNLYNPVKNVTLKEMEHYINQLGNNFLIVVTMWTLSGRGINLLAWALVESPWQRHLFDDKLYY